MLCYRHRSMIQPFVVTQPQPPKRKQGPRNHWTFHENDATTNRWLEDIEKELADQPPKREAIGQLHSSCFVET